MNESAVPERDYQKYLDGIGLGIGLNKEITDSGTARAGKSNNRPKRVTLAVRIILSLSQWVDSIAIKSLADVEYAGTREEILAAADILEKLSQQFLASALSARSHLTLLEPAESAPEPEVAS